MFGIHGVMLIEVVMDTIHTILITISTEVITHTLLQVVVMAEVAHIIATTIQHIVLQHTGAEMVSQVIISNL